ncbi:ataxin-10-like [Pecten maximus]|uniref:ataxin-10-like n=1 Tax=Pecten maximus TaxID=6579 RepID=UPI001458B1BC|nr:ataxin-10-like [Pecten maximus]
MDCEINNCFIDIAGFLDNLESDGRYQRIENSLKELTNQFKDASLREKVNKNHVETIGQVLFRCNESHDNDLQSEVICCTTECFRTLRNACAGSKNNQDLVIKSSPSCLDCCETTITQCLQEQTNSLTKITANRLVLLRCCVQFLGNLAAGHQGNSQQVWKQLSSSFRCLLNVEDDKLTQYVCMAIHTCLQGGGEEWSSKLGADLDFQQILCHILGIVTATDVEWGMYVLEDAMTIKGVLEVIDQQESEKEKIFALEVMLNQLRCMSESEEPRNGALEVCVENVQYLSKQVVSNAYNILILASQDTQMTNTLHPEVIVKQIEALGEATSNHTIYGILQEDADLLTSAVYLLEAIHKLGKDSSNDFSSVAKLASDDVDTDHPVFGLRKDLVRLIGNLCFRHRPNQQRAANLNALPLIMDQTNIDKKNPYITQWAILAVRNLCEECPDNKAVLAGLKKQGLADNSAVLRELGMDAEIKDNKIYVKPPSKGGQG